MNRYNAQILNDKGEYHLQFETDSKDNFKAVEKVVRKCMDRKPQTNFDKITESVESLTKWICENYGKMIPECVPCKATIKVCEFQCDDCLIEWLHQEAEDEDI